MMAELIIAVRAGLGAKSRLGDLIDRAALVKAMLRDMVEAAMSCPAMSRIHVVTPSPLVAAGLGINIIVEPDAAGMNVAFGRACATLAPETPVVLLPGDLPQLRASDLSDLIAAYRFGELLVVPSASDGGTGAIMLAAGRNMRFSFGPGSFARHMAEPGARRFDCVAIGEDLDRPEDVPRALQRGGSHSRACLVGQLQDLK